jgi:ubiquinone/menaquinone biosynthesis C-methylase UbiE
MPNWQRFGSTWDQLGRKNAPGAILTVDGKVVDWNIGEFLATGRLDVRRFMSVLERLSPNTRRARLLDFGCGVGRVTRPFARHFDEVIGVDVARSMIEWARSLHADCDTCTFVLNRAPNLRCFADDSFSVVYSRIVLQHIRPSIVRGYIPELIRVLEPGGALMFQLPEETSLHSRGSVIFEEAPVVGHPLKRRLPKPVVSAWRRLKYAYLTASWRPRIEMFGIAREEVESIIRAAGGRVLEAKPDDSHGPDGNGFEYWVTKDRPA